MTERICPVDGCGKETKTERGLKCHITRVHNEQKYTRREWLKEKYDAGLQSTEIAEICDCDRETIRRWANRFGFGRDVAESSKLTVENDSNHPFKERSGKALFFTHREKGYEIVGCGVDKDQVKLHRLLATLEVDDLSELDGKVVHHQSNVPWDNRPENLEVMDRGEHTKHHHESEVGGFQT